MGDDDLAICLPEVIAERRAESIRKCVEGEWPDCNVPCGFPCLDHSADVSSMQGDTK